MNNNKNMNPEDIKILLADDEPDIIEIISYSLKNAGYNIYTATNGIEAVEQASKIEPHLIILDVMMPEMDGIEVCEKIREKQRYDDILILFLTARSEDYSELAGFSAGADDYITKPIKPKLLVSRVNAILKRKRKKKNDGPIEIGDIHINKSNHKLLYLNNEIHLARKEFNLLYYLMTVPGKVFTREEIISTIWKDAIVGDRTIDVHIRKIREKIGSNHIKTIKGIGYKFDI